MKEATELHQTARAWYALKVQKGEPPQVVVGGALDGLAHYEVELEGQLYWLTDVGLFTPPQVPPT